MMPSPHTDSHVVKPHGTKVQFQPCSTEHTGRLDEIAADLAGSDPCEMAANQADRGSELYRSSYKNMVHNIFANEFRKAGTTSRPGARTPGGKTTRSARGFAKFLGPLTSLGVHASNIPPKNMLCMARKYGLTEEEVGIIRITRWYKSSIPESGMNVSGHDFGSLADDEKAQAAPELAQASAGAPAPTNDFAAGAAAGASGRAARRSRARRTGAFRGRSGIRRLLQDIGSSDAQDDPSRGHRARGRRRSR